MSIRGQEAGSLVTHRQSLCKACYPNCLQCVDESHFVERNATTGRLLRLTVVAPDTLEAVAPSCFARAKQNDKSSAVVTSSLGSSRAFAVTIFR